MLALTPHLAKNLWRMDRRGLFLSLKTSLDNGRTTLEIAENDQHFATYLQYRNGLKEYESYKRQKKLEMCRKIPDVFIRYRPSGTGKTRWLDDTFGIGNWTFVPDNNGHWFDNCNCDVMCFDEVKVGSIPTMSQLLRLTDRFGFQVPVKGGFTFWKPRVIVFTSNSHLFTWFTEIVH